MSALPSIPLPLFRSRQGYVLPTQDKDDIDKGVALLDVEVFLGLRPRSKPTLYLNPDSIRQYPIGGILPLLNGDVWERFGLVGYTFERP